MSCISRQRLPPHLPADVWLARRVTMRPARASSLAPRFSGDGGVLRLGLRKPHHAQQTPGEVPPPPVTWDTPG